jgi:hypothetical protein
MKILMRSDFPQVTAFDSSVMDTLKKVYNDVFDTSKKPLDKPASSVQNKPMTITLATAVLLTIKEFATKPSFSAYDITSAIRDKVNSKAIELNDVKIFIYRGQPTADIPHFRVNTLVREFTDNKLVDLTFKDNGSFREYSATHIDTSAPKVPTPTPISYGIFSLPLPNPKAPSVPKAALNIPQQNAALPANNSLTVYLDGKVGTQVTMKQIQSRFDSIRGVSCKDYANRVESLGYSVHKNGSPSKWTVNP